MARIMKNVKEIMYAVFVGRELSARVSTLDLAKQVAGDARRRFPRVPISIDQVTVRHFDEFGKEACDGDSPADGK